MTTLGTHLDGGGAAELRNTVLSGVSIKSDATPPANPRVGQLHYDTGTDAVQVWDGTTWQDLGAGGASVPLSDTTPESSTTAGDAGTSADVSRADHAHPITTDFDGNAISNFSATLNDQTGTTYTLQASDNGKVVTLDNASSVVVTVPSTLGAGFNCLLIQLGVGQVTVTAGSGMTLHNRRTHSKLAGQFAAATLAVYQSGHVLLAGDTE